MFKQCENDAVCELHFEDQHVMKADPTTLSSGSTYSLPRKLYRLTPNAVPMNCHRDESELQSDSVTVESSSNIVAVSVRFYKAFNFFLKKIDNNMILIYNGIYLYIIY